MRKTEENKKNADPFQNMLTVRPISSHKINQNLKKNNANRVKIDNGNKSSRAEEPPPSYKDRTALKHILRAETKPFRNNRVPQQLVKMPLSKAMKMIQLKIPRFGKSEAIVAANFDQISNEEITADEEQNYLKSYDISSNFVLNDVQKEIDASASQLKQIQDILITKKLQENLQNVSVKKSNTKSSKERVVSNLNVLNKRLEDMQEKYFSNSKINNSIKDDEVKVDVKQSEMSNTNTKMHGETKLNAIIEKLKTYKLESDSNDCSDRDNLELMLEKLETNVFIKKNKPIKLAKKEPKLMLNRKLYDKPENINDEESSDMEVIPDDTLLKPSSGYFDCYSKVSNERESYFSTNNSARRKIFKKRSKTNYDKSTSYVDMTPSVFDDTTLQNNVLKSNYLMKSLQVDSNSLLYNANNRLTKSQSDQFFEEVEDSNEKNNLTDKRDIESLYQSLHSALKDSFYTPSLPKLEELP